jgi:hypothetical protein
MSQEILKDLKDALENKKTEISSQDHNCPILNTQLRKLESDLLTQEMKDRCHANGMTHHPDLDLDESNRPPWCKECLYKNLHDQNPTFSIYQIKAIVNTTVETYQTSNHTAYAVVTTEKECPRTPSTPYEFDYLREFDNHDDDNHDDECPDSPVYIPSPNSPVYDPNSSDDEEECQRTLLTPAKFDNHYDSPVYDPNSSDDDVYIPSAKKAKKAKKEADNQYGEDEAPFLASSRDEGDFDSTRAKGNGKYRKRLNNTVDFKCENPSVEEGYGSEEAVGSKRPRKAEKI